MIMVKNMSKEEKLGNPKFVTNELCMSRIQTLEAKMDSIKKSVYVAALAITTTLTIIQFFLSIYG